MKNYFKNTPIEITHNEFMILAKTLYSSFQAMISGRELIYLIDVESRKVYGFDEVSEMDKIKEYANKINMHLLQIK